MIARVSILSSLVYVFCGDEVLLIHRDARRASVDFHAGKWNGLGGKAHPDESILDCAIRELREEAGLAPERTDFRFLGFVQFPLFRPQKGEDWNVGIFAVEVRPEVRVRPLPACDEGSLHWLKLPELAGLPFWPGDVHFLPFVLRREPFFGIIRYQDGVVASAEVHPISGDSRTVN